MNERTFTVNAEFTVEMGTKDVSEFAAQMPIRWLNGAFREAEPPGPMRVNAKEVAARRAANKRARQERKRQRKQGRHS